MEKKYKVLIIISIIFQIFYALYEGASLYYLWIKSDVGQLLVNMPIDVNSMRGILSDHLLQLFNRPHGYFIFYTSRFWGAALASIIMAGVFYLILKLLKKYKERFFDEGEAELGFLAAVALGWPKFFVFAPLVFLAVILVSVARLIFYKETYTTIGAPIFLAGVIAFVFGNQLLAYLHFYTTLVI